MPAPQNLFVLIVFLMAVIGHVGIWCAVYNQVHATRWTRRVRKLCEKVIYVVVVGLLVLLCCRFFCGIGWELGWQFGWVNVYHWACLIGFAAVTARWLFRIVRKKSIAKLESETTRLISPAAEIKSPVYHGFQARCLGLIPFNQSLQLSIEQREFRLSHWPASLDGMVIAHLSDLHFTGKIDVQFFRNVVSACNQLKPDFVFITGDIIDSVECLDWLPQTLGRLSCSQEKIYILGNHDIRVGDETRLRAAIQATGFRPATGAWQRLQFQGSSFFVAGDELPWFAGAESLSSVDGPSILLAHSPDRVFNAARLGVDLVLAGHCHGGQIRIPLIGPVIAPSRHGVRFASGTHQIDGTLMHVTRGISADDPIRLNCPPELNLVTIRTANQA